MRLSLQDFEIQRLSGQTESLKKLIEGTRKSRNINGDHLVKLGSALQSQKYCVSILSLVTDSEVPNNELSLLIHRIALQKLLAESNPRFDRVFMVNL